MFRLKLHYQGDLYGIITVSRPQWPRGLRRGYASAPLLGLRVRNTPAAWMCVSYEFYVWVSVHHKLIYIKKTNMMQLGSMFICNCNIAVTNERTAKLHHVGSFYIYSLMNVVC